MKGKDLANRGIVSGGAVESRKVCTLRRLLSTGRRHRGKFHRGKFQLKSGGDRRMVLTSAGERGGVELERAPGGIVPPCSCGSGKASGNMLLL
jgi:hypothetical protein